MDNKFITWLRWVLLFPGAIIIGFLATFPLHWLLYFLLNGGETDLGSLKFFVQLLSFGASWREAEYLLSPFIIAFVYLIVGAEIAPKYKFKTGLVLFGIYLLAWALMSVISLSQGGASNGQFSGRTVLAIVGAILGLIVVKLTNKNQGKKNKSTYEFGTNRKKTELDNILDEVVLDNYYETHGEKRDPEKDKKIVEESYLKPKS